MVRAAEFLAPQNFNGPQGMYSGGGGQVIWRHGGFAPFDRFEGDAGTALLWGDAVACESDAMLTAEEVYRCISQQSGVEGERSLARHSGLYAWMFLSQAGGIVVGADPFGLFPIYYFHEGAAFGLSTNLASLREHPNYNAAIDPVGMIRYMIENGSVGPRSVEQSGRRLETGCSLRYDPVSNSLWLNQHPSLMPRSFGSQLSERDAIELSVDVTRQAVQRHCVGPVDYAMLSGGLDSRHVLALAQQAGHRPICCTAGRPSDYESIFARQVAQSLGLEWFCEDDSIETLECDVQDALRLQSLGGGFSTVSLNGATHLGVRSGKRYLSGLVLDAHYAKFYADKNTAPRASFESALNSWINRSGVDLETLSQLCVSTDMRDAMEAAVSEIRQEWEQLEGTENDRVWRTIMRFRVRAHLGGHAWKDSFRAWPSLPGVDVPMIETIRGIPEAYLADRKLQQETMRLISPELARIPLVGLSHSPRPIIPNFKADCQRRYYRTRAKLMGRERRSQLHRFYRAINLDQASWRHIRELAEPHREALHEYFDADALQRYAPLPTHHFPGRGSRIRGQGGRRLIYGLMLWHGNKAKM